MKIKEIELIHRVLQRYEELTEDAVRRLEESGRYVNMAPVEEAREALRAFERQEW